MIAVDPGNTTGIAVFRDALLIRAIKVCEPVHSAWHWEGLIGAHVFCEVPQVYPDEKTKLQDLITLSVTAGYVVGEMRPRKVTMVFPKTWKGQRPKPVDNRLTLKLLNDRERQIANGADHNVLDAIGIGLWALKRR